MATLHQPAPIRGGLYVVGYFDLLGQSNALVPYVEIDGPENYIKDIKRAFSQISSRVHAFRNDITSFFDDVQSSRLVDCAPDGTPQPILEVAAELEGEQIQLQGFSDTVVAYVPLGTSTGDISLYRVGAMLISTACTILYSIARGAIVRGAIEASWAMEPFVGEIYGPALMRAHYLEGKADWPRVVLGNGIEKLWHNVIAQTDNSSHGMMNRVFAGMQLGMTFKDSDGQLAIDYLGESPLSFFRDVDDDMSALVDAAHVELERQLEQYSSDGKVRSKLQAALNYFNSRVGPLTPERRDRAKTFAKLRHQAL